MMDENKIISELQSRYGLNLKENDPIFAALLLNKIALREYLAEFENHLAASVTKVAIKEDITVTKLQKLLDNYHIKNRKEVERVLNQFTNNLHGRLQSINQNPVVSSKLNNWLLWVISAFWVGLLLGGLCVELVIH